MSEIKNTENNLLPEDALDEAVGGIGVPYLSNLMMSGGTETNLVRPIAGSKNQYHAEKMLTESEKYGKDGILTAGIEDVTENSINVRSQIIKQPGVWC